MKRIPIVKMFGGDVIGFMEIDEQHIPTHGNYVFAIGGLVKEYQGPPGNMPLTPIAGEFELREVAIVDDTDYAQYLQQIGILK